MQSLECVVVMCVLKVCVCLSSHTISRTEGLWLAPEHVGSSIEIVS